MLRSEIRQAFDVAKRRSKKTSGEVCRLYCSGKIQLRIRDTWQTFDDPVKGFRGLFEEYFPSQAHGLYFFKFDEHLEASKIRDMMIREHYRIRFIQRVAEKKIDEQRKRFEGIPTPNPSRTQEGGAQVTF